MNNKSGITFKPTSLPQYSDIPLGHCVRRNNCMVTRITRTSKNEVRTLVHILDKDFFMFTSKNRMAGFEARPSVNGDFDTMVKGKMLGS